MHVPMIVAIVMPLIGLLVVPMIPTIRDETVTKKKPKKMISTASRRLLGKCVGRPGMKEIASARKSEPIATTLIGMSLSVRRARLRRQRGAGPSRPDRRRLPHRGPDLLRRRRAALSEADRREDQYLGP